MRYRLLILVTIFILSLSIVHGLSSSTVNSAFHFDITDTYTDATGRANLSNVAASVDSSNFKLGTASIDTSAGGVDIDTPTEFVNFDADFSVSVWVRLNALDTVTQRVFWLVDSGVDDGVSLLYYDGSPRFRFVAQGTAAETVVDNPNATTWYNIVLSYDHSVTTTSIYLNGDHQIDWVTDIDRCTSSICNQQNIGYRTGSGQEFNGQIDELVFFNTTLTQSDVTELWNNGDGVAFPFSTPPTPSEFNYNISYVPEVKEYSNNSYNVSFNWTISNFSEITAEVNIFNDIFGMQETGSLYGVNGTANFTAYIRSPLIEHNNTPYSFYINYNVTIPHNISVSTYPLTSTYYHINQTGKNTTDPQNATDGDLTTGTLFDSLDWVFYNLTFPQTTMNINEIRINMSLENVGSIPFSATQFDFYCNDNINDPYDIAAQIGTTGSGSGNSYDNFILNISREDFESCMYSQEYFILSVISGSPNGGNTLFELTELYIDYNHTLSYNTTSQLQYVVQQYNHYNITVSDGFSDASLSNFNISVTTNATIQAQFNYSTYYHRATNANTETILFSKENYVNRTYSSQSTSTDLQGEIFPIGIYNISYSQFETYSGINYTRNLSYSIYYACFSGTSELDRIINNNVDASQSLTCGQTGQVLTGSYKPSSEGVFDIAFYFNTTIGSAETEGNSTMTADLFNPSVILNYSTIEGFVTPAVDLTLTCLDNMFPGNLTYNLSFNSVSLFDGLNANGTTQSNSTVATTGTNTLTGYCSDLFGTSNETDSFIIYYTEIILIDEQENILFNLDNVSSAIVYFDDNSSFYDFKDQNKTSVNFTSSIQNKLRFEFEYSGGTIITRYADVQVVNDIEDNLRVCINKEGVTHYEQLLTSSIEKPVVLKSVYSDCIVAADYTRFAYQNALVLKAYTIETNYYLYVWDDGDLDNEQIMLASVDGSIATYINLDALEFQQDGYNTDIVGDTIFVEKRNDNETNIFYLDVEEDNTALQIAIIRTDTDEVLLNTSSFANPNMASVIFNYNSLAPDVNETTLFKVIATRTDAGGTSDLVSYFNTSGVTGSIASGVVFFISLLLIIFGLTFTATQSALGWFGVLIMIVNIVIVSLGTAVWYLTFMQAINIILLVYIVFVMIGKNQASLV